MEIKGIDTLDILRKIAFNIVRKELDKKRLARKVRKTIIT
jgi:hypothetical protein